MVTSRIFSPTIQLGAIVQVLTVCGTLAAGIFTAGQWVTQIRSDLRAETATRLDHDAALARDLAALLANEVDARKSDSVTLQAGQAQMLATLARIDRSFQHVFAVAQPQPRAK
jgi:hypothetical protein